MTSSNRRRDTSAASVESDPGSELGLHSPVRDKEKLGDEQYSVTPPRKDVRPPPREAGAGSRCEQCSADLDPERAYRVDGEEYAYYFCDVSCRDRWSESGTPDAQRDAPAHDRNHTPN